MESPDGARPKKRRRTEHSKRSKLGCRTCLEKRVKCDEQHPCCGRCGRLELECKWATEQTPALSVRRRGHGPIKARHDWTPPEITPKAILQDASTHSEAGLCASPSQDSRPDAPDTPDAGVQQPDHQLRLELGQDLQLPDSTSNDEVLGQSVLASTTDLQIYDVMHPSQSNVQSVSATSAIAPRTWDISSEELNSNDQVLYGNTFMPELLPMQIPDSWLPLDFWAAPAFNPTAEAVSSAIGGSDLPAVTFHRVVFAPMKSTRNSAVSAHSIFLDRAFSDNMAMHFLLAVSHSELAIYQGQGSRVPQRSWLHFNRGSQILVEKGDLRAHHGDHVGMVLSFLYMYMFWMRRDPFNQSTLRELSRSVLRYVKAHSLDSLSSNTGASSSDQALLCRILTYLYDRDGFCYFFGCGGIFASYVNANPEKRRRIWRLSQRNTLWTDNRAGPDDYISLEASTDTQDGRVTEVYFQLISIHHDVNCYSQDDPDIQLSVLGSRIEANLERVVKEQQALFTLVAQHEKGQATSPPSLMGLVTVAFYYALQIYFSRSRDSPFGGLPVPSQVQTALTELVKTAFQTVATGPVQLLERFQWALLIAGIETHDSVHREWITRNMADPAMKLALQSIMEAKKAHGNSISMKAIRQLVSTERLFNT